MKTLKISGRKARLPDWIWESLLGHEDVPDDFESNGATWAPDEVGDLMLWAAAHIHDWRYHVGGTARDRLRADRELAYNTLYLALLEGWSVERATAVAKVVFRLVRMLGAARWNRRRDR